MNAVAENQNGTACCPTTDENYVRALRPRVTIREEQDAFHVDAEMPGVTKDSLQVELDKDTLKLVGRKPARLVEGRILHQETAAGEYRRQFVLGREVDRNRIAAKVVDGVVTVTLPKVEEVKPRLIQIS